MNWIGKNLFFLLNLFWNFKSGDGTRVLNTHFIINDQGEIVGHYSKIHLFDVQAGSLIIRESDFTQPGSTIFNPIETPAGRIGLGIVNNHY